MSDTAPIPAAASEPPARVSVTYTRAVAWNYGNKEEASATLTQSVGADDDPREIAVMLQACARELVTLQLRDSGVQLVRDQAGGQP